MGNNMRIITPDEVAAYNIAGVTLLRGVLDIQTVNLLRRCIDRAAENSAESPFAYDLSTLTEVAEADAIETLRSESDGQHDVANILEHVKASKKRLLLDEVADGKGRFFLDTAVSHRDREFRQFCLKGVIPKIAGALLASEKVNFFGDQVFIKEPGTRERTAFHQDAPYFEIEGDQCCVMWIPTDPVTVRHGGMQYVRGSHRKGLYAPNVFISQTRLPGSEGADLPDIEGNTHKYDIVHFNVEPGDILVHHYLTWHGTGGKLSKYQVRRAASLRYCGDDIRFKSRRGVPAQLHHTHNLKDGDPIDCSDFPVVWRQPTENAFRVSPRGREDEDVHPEKPDFWRAGEDGNDPLRTARAQLQAQSSAPADQPGLTTVG